MSGPGREGEGVAGLQVPRCSVDDQFETAPYRQREDGIHLEAVGGVGSPARFQAGAHRLQTGLVLGGEEELPQSLTGVLQPDTGWSTHCSCVCVARAKPVRSESATLCRDCSRKAEGEAAQQPSPTRH